MLSFICFSLCLYAYMPICLVFTDDLWRLLCYQPTVCPYVLLSIRLSDLSHRWISPNIDWLYLRSTNDHIHRLFLDFATNAGLVQLVTRATRIAFSSRVSAICCKARRRPNLILNCFYSKDASSLLSAFITYVRPILQYCCVAWNPFLVIIKILGLMR